jgi:crotonobetainyl-CoA:carnitine CoA-transferase CaiB-like acyl-CoA transferase
MPVKFSASQPRALRHPANLGEHSQEVARELGVELAARPRPSA